MTLEVKKICCIGAGYVGGPTMAVIADKCPNITINVVDLNQERIKLWNNSDLNKLPVYETGLDRIIERCRGKNLHFSTKIRENIEEADMIFISVNTPTKNKGLGAGKASDLKWVEECARDVAKFAKGHTIVVEKSTLPVKTAEAIKIILSAAQKSSNSSNQISFDVLSNPEFLAEGTAIKDLEKPDRVLIGGENINAINSLSKIYGNWVPKNKILHTNIWSSELAKLTANAFLAQRVSSINSIAALCEKTGADVKEVANAVGSDSRIGSKFLNSGPGFGGSCFKKDILNLVYIANHFGLKEVADFWENVVDFNTFNQSRISQLIVKKLFGTISGKKTTILGFAFKANTNDTRESPAINICKDFLEEGAHLSIHDPKVSSLQIEKDLGVKEHKTTKCNFASEGSWCFKEEITDAIEGSDAIVILTEWDEYKKLDWNKVSTLMRKPAWLFDSRAMISKIDIEKTNLNFWSIGDGSF